MDNEQLNDLINSGNEDALGEASKAIKARILATGVTEKQASAAMYYAYEHGHAYGEAEVQRTALNLCTEVFEAENF